MSTISETRTHGDPPPLRPDSVDPRVVWLAGLLLLGGAGLLAANVSWRMGALYLLGGLMGLTLYHAAFGFASNWRRFLADGPEPRLGLHMAHAILGHDGDDIL